MIVELKKTKITKSILEQSMIGASYLYLNNFNYDILGWCIGRKNVRYILLYHRDFKIITKLHYINSTKAVELVEEKVDERWLTNNCKYPEGKTIKAYLSDINTNITILTQTVESNDLMEQHFKNLKQFIQKVKTAGQIYI